MKTPHNKAFTLTELLVVVIVVGVLSAVILPKFNKMVETRKTTEAEELMAAVRNEQEKRCALDKNYLTDINGLQDVLPAAQTKNFTYALLPTGIEARNKGGYLYTLKMPSYADGRLCCEDAERCGKLNKNYPLCSDLMARADYQHAAACAGPSTATPVPTDPCEAEPNQPGCCRPPNIWVVALNKCQPKTVCGADQAYDELTNSCIDIPSPPAPPTPTCTSSTWQIKSGTIEPVDTCPGADTSSAYVCGGGFTGSCTDISDKMQSTSTALLADRREQVPTPSGALPDDSCDGDQVASFTCRESDRENGPRNCVDVVGGKDGEALAHATGYLYTRPLQNGSCPGNCPSDAASCTLSVMNQMTPGGAGMEFSPEKYGGISHCLLPGKLENGQCKHDFISCGYPKNGNSISVFNVYCYGKSDTPAQYSWRERIACCNP